MSVAITHSGAGRLGHRPHRLIAATAIDPGDRPALAADRLACFAGTCREGRRDGGRRVSRNAGPTPAWWQAATRPARACRFTRTSNERDFAQPIVSVSLGLPATFLWGGKTRADGVRRVRLLHGDVVVFGRFRITF